MLSLGYRYVYAIVMSIAGLALCLRVSENSALFVATGSPKPTHCIILLSRQSTVIVIIIICMFNLIKNITNITRSAQVCIIFKMRSHCFSYLIEI